MRWLCEGASGDLPEAARALLMHRCPALAVLLCVSAEIFFFNQLEGGDYHKGKKAAVSSILISTSKEEREDGSLTQS